MSVHLYSILYCVHFFMDGRYRHVEEEMGKNKDWFEICNNMRNSFSLLDK